jgi:hypothetical protein
MPLLVIAHRGDSAHRPENTLASFASALEVGSQLVEFDVRLTRDGMPVVIHDATLDRTTTGTGPVREHTLSEVRAVSAGYPELFASAYASERVPTLAEALGFLRGRARVMIEIKEEPGGRLGIVLDSLVSGGAIISGGRVERCVLGPEVRVNSYAKVVDSVLMDGVDVGRHARIAKAIVDKGVHIPANFVVGEDADEDRRRFTVTPAGVVVIARGARLD